MSFFEQPPPHRTGWQPPAWDRPSEAVLDILPEGSQQGEFIKEDGERVIDEQGRRIATA